MYMRRSVVRLGQWATSIVVLFLLFFGGELRLGFGMMEWWVRWEIGGLEDWWGRWGDDRMIEWDLRRGSRGKRWCEG
jgi:hypothetical protein